MLENLGPLAPPSTPLLVRALNVDKLHRDRALRTLNAIGASADNAVPAVSKILIGDTNADHRYAAAKFLQTLGAKSRTEIPSLIVALRDPGPGVSRVAQETLKLIAPESLPTNGDGDDFDNP